MHEKKKDPIEARLVAQLAGNTRWKNTEAAAENRRALNTLKAAKLMEQAHALLHPDTADVS